MKREKQYRMERWKETRKKGRKHFVLFKGILAWGLITGFLFFIYQTFFVSGLSFSQLLTVNLLTHFIVTMSTFMLAGIFFGYIMWAINEKQFRSSEDF